MISIEPMRIPAICLWGTKMESEELMDENPYYVVNAPTLRNHKILKTIHWKSYKNKKNTPRNDLIEISLFVARVCAISSSNCSTVLSVRRLRLIPLMWIHFCLFTFLCVYISHFTLMHFLTLQVFDFLLHVVYVEGFFLFKFCTATRSDLTK